MKNINIDMPNDVKLVLQTLKDSGFESYIVGGCVRDALLNLTPHDWDITTNATPKEIQNVFKTYKMINNNGLKHGTISILLNDEIYEITTYRVDGNYSDGRHPDKVSFTTNIVDDLSRRDFTINAMAYDGNILLDPFNGKYDLKNYIIRCVGEPDKRFNEDGLRILRALRFASKLNFVIYKTTSESIKKNNTLLTNISKERIQTELNGILLGTNAENILREYSDVFSFIIPELKSTIEFDQHSKYHSEDVYNHSVSVLHRVPQDLELKLAALLHDIGKVDCYSEEVIGNSVFGHFYGHALESSKKAKNILENLKYSKKEIADIVWLIENHDVEISENKKNIKKLMNKSPSIELFEKLIKLCYADKLCHINLEIKFNVDDILKLEQEIINDESCFKLKDLAINGYDLIDLGFAGKEIGKALNEVFEKVLSDELKNNKKELIEYIKKNRD